MGMDTHNNLTSPRMSLSGKWFTNQCESEMFMHNAAKGSK